MDILLYDQAAARAHWLAELRLADWEAGALLCRMLDEGTLERDLGEGAKIVLLTDGDRLVSYCTFAPYDDVWDDRRSCLSPLPYNFSAYYTKFSDEIVNQIKTIR